MSGIGEKTIERVKEQYKIINNIKAFKSKYIPSDKYKVDKDINLWQGDCLELMSHIPDKSVDMILADLPYGTTACSWDEVIPFEPLWSHYKRIIKDDGAIVLFGSEPFSSRLRMSNLDWYRYDWVWQKKRPSMFQQANKRPMKDHENIVVFYKHQPIYNQELQELATPNKRWRRNKAGTFLSQKSFENKESVQTKTGYNRQIITYGMHNVGQVHPTQKPVELLEFLIKTYTNDGMTVLDNTMGSGSTGVACKNLDRRFIGIELDENYYNIAKKRINDLF